MNYIISQKDYERIQAAVRWYERNKNSLVAPHRRQRIAPPGSGDDRWGYLTANASTGNTIAGKLDDSNGDAITIYFDLDGITDVQDGHITLSSGDYVHIKKRGDYWYCTQRIEGTEDCT